MLHRLDDRLLGDGVEDDPLDLLVLERLLLLQDLEDMPGDRLALAVGVGGENELVGAFERRAISLSRFCDLGSTSQSMWKSCIGIDRAVLGRQVAHMAERGQTS